MSEVGEDAAARARKYIDALTSTLIKTRTETSDTLVNPASINRVTDAIRRYLQDSEHYLNQNRSVTSLASVAYAEGLLDALTFLGLTTAPNAE